MEDVRWHAQVTWSDIAQADTVLGQQAGQRVDCASVFQVTHHGYLGKKEKAMSTWRPTPDSVLIHFREGPEFSCSIQTEIVWPRMPSLSPNLSLTNSYCSLTVMPLTVPSSSRMVKMSSRAWVGCSPTPSPAFITGLRQCLAANWGEARGGHSEPDEAEQKERQRRSTFLSRLLLPFWFAESLQPPLTWCCRHKSARQGNIIPLLSVCVHAWSLQLLWACGHLTKQLPQNGCHRRQSQPQSACCNLTLVILWISMCCGGIRT